MFEAGHFIKDDPIRWVILGVFVAVILVSAWILRKLLTRKVAYYSVIGGLLLTLIAWFFSLTLLWVGFLTCTFTMLGVFFIINQADLRPYVANSLSGKNTKHHTEKVFDRHALFQKIFTAVDALSKSKIGAIITLERNTKLDDFMKSGTAIDAPVTPELLLTIFYPGTRLHDGAVVIRRDQIAAASVYYTPTTKPLTGKFGSRHRAAIGISEVSDSVTIVVSEETGRVSLAVDGELIHVSPDTFLRSLEDYMIAEEEK